jgi:hypothetical protein
MASPAIHHHVVALVRRVVLVVHPELLWGRLRPRRSRRRRSIGVERNPAASGRRAGAGAVEVLSVVLMWVECLARSSLVSRVVGHQRATRR